MGPLSKNLFSQFPANGNVQGAIHRGFLQSKQVKWLKTLYKTAPWPHRMSSGQNEINLPERGPWKVCTCGKVKQGPPVIFLQPPPEGRFLLFENALSFPNAGLIRAMFSFLVSKLLFEAVKSTYGWRCGLSMRDVFAKV